MNYITAIEATLVPEKDFLADRSANRVARIISADPAVQNEIVMLFKELYKLRSKLVHGEALVKTEQDWLIDNCEAIEIRVRQAIVNGVQAIPSDPEGRTRYLSNLYDIADMRRGDEAFTSFPRFRLMKRDRDSLAGFYSECNSAQSVNL